MHIPSYRIPYHTHTHTVQQDELPPPQPHLPRRAQVHELGGRRRRRAVPRRARQVRIRWGSKKGGQVFWTARGSSARAPAHHRCRLRAPTPPHSAQALLPSLSPSPAPSHTHTPPPQTPTTTRTRPRSFVRAQGAASGIVYCLSRAEAEGVAQHLRDAGRVSAAHYHAGMSHKQRTEVQNAWQDGRATVIVATIAFGARGLVVLFLRGRACLLFCPAPGGSGAGLRCATSNMHTQQHTTTRYYTQHQQLCHAFTKTSTQPPSTPAHLQHQPTTTTRQLLQKT